MGNEKRTWKLVTPLPLEFNGHGFLYECTKCHKDTHYFGGKKYPPYECPYCKEKKNAKV